MSDHIPSLCFLLSSQQICLIQEALLLLPPHPNVLSLRQQFHTYMSQQSTSAGSSSLPPYPLPPSNDLGLSAGMFDANGLHKGQEDTWTSRGRKRTWEEDNDDAACQKIDNINFEISKLIDEIEDDNTEDNDDNDLDEDIADLTQPALCLRRRHRPLCQHGGRPVHASWGVTQHSTLPNFSAHSFLVTLAETDVDPHPWVQSIKEAFASNHEEALGDDMILDTICRCKAFSTRSVGHSFFFFFFFWINFCPVGVRYPM
jgi:hypothetical protein